MGKGKRNRRKVDKITDHHADAILRRASSDTDEVLEPNEQIPMLTISKPEVESVMDYHNCANAKPSSMDSCNCKSSLLQKIIGSDSFAGRYQDMIEYSPVRAYSSDEGILSFGDDTIWECLIPITSEQTVDSKSNHYCTKGLAAMLVIDVTNCEHLGHAKYVRYWAEYAHDDRFGEIALHVATMHEMQGRSGLSFELEQPLDRVALGDSATSSDKRHTIITKGLNTPIPGMGDIYLRRVVLWDIIDHMVSNAIAVYRRGIKKAAVYLIH